MRDLPGAEIVGIFRFEPDARATLLTATGSRTPLGSLWKLEPPLAIEAVLSTGRSARVDDYTHAFGETLDRVRHEELRSSVARPIVAGERLLLGNAQARTRRAAHDRR
jgi:hypothetical protein